jgi:Protein of unknown function (DUF4232)
MKPLSTAHRMTIGVAVACAAIVLPAAALAASAGHSTSARAAVPAAKPKPCVNAHPALPGGAFVWSGNPGDGFAGGQGYEVEITNVGKKTCTLRGVPGLNALLGNGKLAGKTIPASSKGKLVVLAPGATAHFGLTIYVPMCLHPQNADVLVYLPGQRQNQSANLGALVCVGKAGGGVLRGSAIQAGTGIPLYDI